MKKKYFIVGLIFITFFVISFITNILGALNPDIISTFKLSLTLSAFLPFAFFIAYGIMSIPAGLLVEKYKEKRIMVFAFGIALVGAIMFFLFPFYQIFIISLFLMGTGMAMLQVAINPLLRVAGGEEHFAFNSVMAQLVFGGASFLAPMFLTKMIADLKDGANTDFMILQLRDYVNSTTSWVAIYFTFAVMLLFMIIFVGLSKFPKVERSEIEKSGNWTIHKELFKNKIVVLYFLGIFAYVGTEQGVSYWLSKFLVTYHNYDPITIGSSIVGWFWGMMAIGCMVGLGLLKLFDSRKILIASSILSLIFLTIALHGDGSLSLMFFPLMGFSLSVMWSIIFSLALNSLKNHHGTFSGILCTAIIGGAVVQLIIGWLGDLFGLRIGLYFIYITLGYILSIGFWSNPIITNETISAKK
ncbi:MAG: MFS transporter [Ignavibacteria bacterium]|jgi:fucose permease|nr:MFS transporter [Ignavibacteria bacterium]